MNYGTALRRGKRHLATRIFVSSNDGAMSAAESGDGLGLCEAALAVLPDDRYRDERHRIP